MKTILITGSTSVTGAAIAQRLALRDSRLVLQYYSNRERSHALGAWLNENNVDHRMFQTDLTLPDNARSLIDFTVEAFDRIDVLINTVGPFAYQPIQEVTPEQWLADIALNLNSSFFTCHHALNELRRSRGHIVNFAFSGVESLKARAMSAGYCAAKTGLVTLTKSLAAALAADRIRVNAICPGLVEDDNSCADERLEMARQIPFGRPVEPDEIARAVAWLIYESPEVMTGSLLAISGGWEY